MSVSVGDILKDTGALLDGHFLLTSGRHSPQYLEKFRILQYPQFTAQVCQAIADSFRDKGVQVVIGPTTGGIIVSYEVARHLGVRGIFADRDGSARVLSRDFAIGPGERVLVVDDVLTTGGSIQEVLDLVKKVGGEVIGVGVMVDRSQTPPYFGGVPFFSWQKLSIPNYPSEECPLCHQGMPLTKLGGS